MVGVASPPSSRSQAVPLPTERRAVGMIYNCSTKVALLPERVELLTVRVPALYMPPPCTGPTLPFVTVRLLRVSFPPLPTSNTRYLLSPLIVILALPPSMMSPTLSVMAGNCEPSVMVAGETRLKLIVSSPAALFASSIA